MDVAVPGIYKLVVSLNCKIGGKHTDKEVFPILFRRNLSTEFSFVEGMFVAVCEVALSVVLSQSVFEQEAI